MRPMATELAAVVLAGGKADRLTTQSNAATKASVRFGGRPLIAYVLAALLASSRVERIVCVGTTKLPDMNPAGAVERLTHIGGGDRLVDSLALGLGAVACFEPSRVLVVSADLPWLTGASIDGFVAEAPPAALAYPVVARAAMEREFPAQQRTYAHLREGAFTGGNMILIDPDVVPKLLPLVDRAYRARKNPLALASLVGWDVALRLVFRRLAIPVAERRVSRLLGASARAVVTDDASIAADIDRLEHLSYTPPSEGVMAGDPR